MSFKDQLAVDAKNVFLNSNEFAEEITYTPSGGSPKTINALVIRHRESPGGEDQGRILQNQVEIYIANDAAEGIDSVSVNGDKVSLPKLVGGTAVDWAVADVLENDNGMWHLLLQG